MVHTGPDEFHILDILRLSVESRQKSTTGGIEEEMARRQSPDVKLSSTPAPMGSVGV